MGEVVITYETLLELLRRERTREDLQDIGAELYEDIRKFVASLKPASREYSNIQRIIRDLYERRERKITNLAVLKSRTPSAVIDFSSMHPEERSLFEALMNILESARKRNIESLFTTKPTTKLKSSSGIRATHNSSVSSSNPVLTTSKSTLQSPAKRSTTQKPTQTDSASRELKTVRFLHAVPKFMGRQLEVYGPFESEDIANLPSDIADILIRKKRAEEFSP